MVSATSFGTFRKLIKVSLSYLHVLELVPTTTILCFISIENKGLKRFLSSNPRFMQAFKDLQPKPPNRLLMMDFEPIKL